MSILVVGSVALDSVKTPFGEIKDAVGGSATYFAVAASYLSPVRMVAVVGADFPHEEIAFLKERAVDFKGLQTVEGRTFRWSGEYSQDLKNRRSLCTRLNVFSGFHPALPEEYRDSEYVFLANIDPELQLNVLEQVERPKLTVCNTMNFWIEGKRSQVLKTLGVVDALIVNDSEALQLSGENDLRKASRAIQSMGPEMVIITKGEQGVFVANGGLFFSSPAYPFGTVTDPTGAGDSFAGGFIGYLAKTGDHNEAHLREAVIYGAVLASFAIERFGLEGLRTLTWEQIEARCERLRTQD